MTFENRKDAGKRLAVALARYKEQRPVVLALPRGGVPVAREVAASLAAPLDLVLARKIGRSSRNSPWGPSPRARRRLCFAMKV
jgi:putative phosphoribosyl transferase